ncbi:ABC transporter ATP-binding protein [Pseudomonas protegens]|jgi:lipopolysaccharide transport system ATP-binding protein|uniref:ABC transporter ATP-binding protein n=2 Tax=Pseudomonas protegens TaxID=380021 RepID=A0ABY2VAC9_9PSED|nr:ABC transporter ATP-binding protein [Pseudomonas protegens]AAY94702.1 putative ABC transporter, ATP-binding protein [Pseudomonas protegens Pf-5]ASE21147.1 ABC transporter ATP-binding protein [Pseudomonas protegens]PNV96701.1 ABC transporter ATP-binding protein [Pseudomonas protegens]QEZ49289.1 ABC transporter ATP-binding protein [Pseudomonas protegens]QEZ58622.1 ABC transporter ATP-binding protein [Pseudomonas protegens]
MSSEIVIRVDSLSKCYQIYDQPRERLKQFLLPRLFKAVGMQPRQYYREFWALKGLSFQIKKGETVGIVGRNGSGKSTLLQMICGTLNPTGGSIETCGRIAALLELGSGFNPEFTGRENVYLNAAVLGLSKEETDRRFDDIAAFAEIGTFIDQPVRSYSSGMVVRLAFAVAINVEPDILVVDEALSVGDELFQRKCFSKIETIRQSGTTILFVSHSGSTVVDLCDRAILLDSGELLTVGEPRRVVGGYQKLLYAPISTRQDIRDAMRTSAEPENGALAVEANAVVYESFEADQEIFDPDFLPQSTVVFESRGALIGEARICTTEGVQVNGLVRSRKYFFRYDVSFNRTVTNVRFAMLIKASTGMPLGGGLSAPTLTDAILVVESGTRFSVEYSFTCHLNPGVFFLNAGVFGCDETGEEVVLHRKADVLAFRVLPVSGNRATELVDFGFECAVEMNA